MTILASGANANPAQTSTAVTLKALCKELKLDPRLAREKLRIAAREPKKFPELSRSHRPNTSWEWTSGSQAEKEARAVLST